MSNHELVYAMGKVVGTLRNGVYEQKYSPRTHLYHKQAGKGMDKSIYLSLRGRCHTWRIINCDTGEVLEMPFRKIELVATEIKAAKYAPQYMVKLADFNQTMPAVQKELPL